MAKKLTGDRELHPANVVERLQLFRGLVEKDLGSITVSILNYRGKENPEEDEATYIRERLMLTRRKSGPRSIKNELPQLLEYCRRLGADAGVVEGFVTRLTGGDIADWDTVRVHGKQCLREIQRAIERAEELDTEGETTIGSPYLGLIVDYEQRTVGGRGAAAPVTLSGGLWDLFRILYEARGERLSNDSIIGAGYGGEASALKAQASNLRDQLAGLGVTVSRAPYGLTES